MKALVLSLVVVLCSSPLYAQDEARLAREVHEDIQDTYKKVRTRTRLACYVAMEDLEYNEHKATIVDSIRRLDGWVHVELVSRRDRAVAEAEKRNFAAARALIEEIVALEPVAAEQAALCGHRLGEMLAHE